MLVIAPANGGVAREATCEDFHSLKGVNDDNSKLFIDLRRNSESPSNAFATKGIGT